MNNFIKLLTFSLLLHFTAFAKDYTLLSPDGKNKIRISINKNISWSILRSQELLLKPSTMNLMIGDGKTLRVSPIVLKSAFSSVNQTITAIIPVKNKLIPEVYNELKITMKGGYGLEFRAYNDGVAYRFVTELGEKPIEVKNENVTFNFNENCQLYLPKENNPELQSHYEAVFKLMKLQEVSPETYGYLPLYLSTPGGTKMVVTESDLTDYPNLFLFGTGGNSLVGKFPKVVLETKPTGNIHMDDILVKKADYLAKTTGNRTYPWRVVIISPDDKRLLENEMVYKLAKPNVIKDTQWIKPGKVAWDWWNSNNIFGVNFESGINTATYKYYVDFAAEYGLEYIILDEGWASSPSDIMKTSPKIDLPKLIKYADKKKIGIILWSLWKPLDKNMDQIMDQYVKWGVKGLKVDFMARADQYMVNFYERLAKAAAQHQLVVDFHGAYKPVGLNRTYPNVLNYEGVKGMEQNKWDTIITPVHNTLLPFTRMVAGPMDFTPGAMLNSNRGQFQINWDSPMSMGTRAHQTSMYVLYDAPLQMLCDNPSYYKREPDYTQYISRFPTVWDQTISLEGKAGSYAVVARRKDSNWYIGGMTNWEARTFNIPLTFLGHHKYKIDILKDGVNVSKQATDYQIISQEVTAKDILTATMAPGGGYTAILTPLGE